MKGLGTHISSKVGVEGVLGVALCDTGALCQGCG